MEKWKDIPGFKDRYAISNHGRVKSKEYKIKRSNGVICTLKEKIMKPNEFTNDYLGVQLYGSEGKRTQLIHRLVASAFIPNPNSKPQVNHIDGDRKNNHVDNLEWVTIKENFDHAKRGGSFEWSDERRDSIRGENNNSVKLTENDVRKIRELYSSGKKQEELASQFGVSQHNISQIVRNEIWKHI